MGWPESFRSRDRPGPGGGSPSPTLIAVGRPPSMVRRVTPDESWPQSWRESYEYDLQELYGQVVNRGYANIYESRVRNALALVQRAAPPAPACSTSAPPRGTCRSGAPSWATTSPGTTSGPSSPTTWR